MGRPSLAALKRLAGGDARPTKARPTSYDWAKLIMDPMAEEVLFKNRRPDRPATIDEYRQSGGYEALIKAVKERTPEEVQ